MSRSGYSDNNDDQWALIRWRGALVEQLGRIYLAAVASAIRGKRGQAMLRELAVALDAMPDKSLIAGELEDNGAVCTLGRLGQSRGLDMSNMDPEDRDLVADAFGIPRTLACEIMYKNDEGGWKETPKQRWTRMRKWVDRHLEVSHGDRG